MNTAAQAALALGDANSTTGSDVANNVIPALQAYGLTVDDLGAKSDALTAITHSTKYGLDDVANMLARTAPTAAKAGLSFDDMTQMIEAMGQKGVPARSAVSEIDTAIKAVQKSTGSTSVTLGELTGKLGISGDAMSAAKTKIDQAAGSTDAYNQIAETHVGLMDSLSSWWEKTATSVGGALAPYSGVFQALTVIGPALTAVSAATQIAAAAQGLLNVAMAMSPIGLIVIAVAGLAAGILLLDSKFHFLQPTLDYIIGLFSHLWDIIQAVGGAIMSIPGVGALVSGVSSVAGMLASGGPAEAGRSYVVGERGPEIFRPSSSGTVSPNAGGGNTTHNWGAGAITIQVNGVGKNGQDISKQIAASLRTEMRQRGIPSGG
jgi:hypothetical protein